MKSHHLNLTNSGHSWAEVEVFKHFPAVGRPHPNCHQSLRAFAELLRYHGVWRPPVSRCFGSASHHCGGLRLPVWLLRSLIALWAELPGPEGPGEGGGLQLGKEIPVLLCMTVPQEHFARGQRISFGVGTLVLRVVCSGQSDLVLRILSTLAQITLVQHLRRLRVDFHPG